MGTCYRCVKRTRSCVPEPGGVAPTPAGLRVIQEDTHTSAVGSPESVREGETMRFPQTGLPFVGLGGLRATGGGPLAYPRVSSREDSSLGEKIVIYSAALNQGTGGTRHPCVSKSFPAEYAAGPPPANPPTQGPSLTQLPAAGQPGSHTPGESGKKISQDVRA